MDGYANARPLQPIDSIEENTDLQQNDAEKHVKHTVEELERFMVVIGMLDALALQLGINIVFTCHVFANLVVDPQVGEYSSWDLLLHSPKNFKTYGKLSKQAWRH